MYHKDFEKYEPYIRASSNYMVSVQLSVPLSGYSERVRVKRITRHDSLMRRTCKVLTPWQQASRRPALGSVYLSRT